MARGIFTLSRVRTKKIKDEWIDYSDVWHYQGNPVNRSAYGFRSATIDSSSPYALPGSDKIFPAQTHLDKLSFDTETASPLPSLDSDADNRWVLANSRDAYHCGGTEYHMPTSVGADTWPGGNGAIVRKISFSNDSQSSLPSVTLDYVDYDPSPGAGFVDKTKGLENTLGTGRYAASTIGNNEAGYIIGGKKYDYITESWFRQFYYSYPNQRGYASSQYYKINYTNDAKSVLPGYSTGESYKGAYFLSFGNLDRGYVGGGEAAGKDVDESSIPIYGQFRSYTGHGPWHYHYCSAMFRLTYSTETSSRVPSINLSSHAANNSPFRSASFSNGADGNSTEAYTMGRDSSDFKYSSTRNASSEIDKISFSTETMNVVSGANRSTFADGKTGFDVRSASSGTSVYAMSAVPGSIDKFADKFNISTGTVSTLTSTGLRTNTFASATGQGKPYQGGYQIPLDRGPATNYYGQPGTPPTETLEEDPDLLYSGGPTYGFILESGMTLFKINTGINNVKNAAPYNNFDTLLLNPRYSNVSISLGASWMKTGNLTMGTAGTNGWYRWKSDPVSGRENVTLPVYASAALSNRSTGYVSGGDEYVGGQNDNIYPVNTGDYTMARSGRLLRSDTHRISYIQDTVTYLPSSSLPREKGLAQYGGDTSTGYVLGGFVNGTENAPNANFYIEGDHPNNTDCEKITYSTETYSTIPTNTPTHAYTTVSSGYNSFAGHTIGTMDYLYFIRGTSGFQKFTFSTENFSALPNVGASFSGGYTRTSDGVYGMLYAHDGASNIGRIQFSTDTLVSAYANLTISSGLYNDGYRTYSWYNGSSFHIIKDDGNMYQQDPSSGTIYYISSSPDDRGPGQNYGGAVYGACNENNGMGGPEQRTAKYHGRSIV